MHVYGFVKVCIEERSGDVQGVAFHLFCRYKCKDGTNYRETDGGYKVLHEVPARAL